jgi:hypothetical protein
MDEKETVDNSALYRLLAENCEHCGKAITGTPTTLWVGDPAQPKHERLAFFCNDTCIVDWWEAPANEGVLASSNDMIPVNEASD